MTMDRPLNLSKRGVGDTIKSGWEVFTGHFWKLAGIQLIFSIPVLLLELTAVTIGWNSDLIEGLTEMLIYPLVRGTMIWSVGSAYLRNSLEVEHALGAGFRKYFPLVGNTLLVGLIMGIPFFVVKGFLTRGMAVSENVLLVALLLILPVFIYLGVRLALMYHSIMFEGQSAYAAIGRSWRLTDGWAERIFGVIFFSVLASIVMMLVPIVVGLLIELLLNSGETLLIVDFGVGVLTDIVAWPFLVAVITCVYYDVQSRYEAVTFSILTDQLD
jgi:membrane-anchored glycerophosphoryl diester phosphodiesterase (GDPDase)